MSQYKVQPIFLDQQCLKTSWMAFTFANWLNSPSHSAVCATCRIGCHIASFYLQCFPTIWQDPPVNRPYGFSFSGNLLYSGASSVHVTSSSGNILKSLSSGQSMINSKIPGWQGFPVQVCCVISTTHLLHIASIAWCVEGTLPLNIQPSTSSWGASRRCASETFTLKAAQTPSYAASISFSVGV